MIKETILKLALLLFFSTAPYASESSMDRSSFIIDAHEKPREALIDLLKLLKIPFAPSLSGVIDATQVAWIQWGKERWQFEERYPEHKENAIPLLQQLGCIDAVPASQSQYDYALVLGGYAPRVQQRIDFLADCWKKGVRFRKVVFLTGERFLDRETEQYALPLKTETELMRFLWDVSDLPQSLKEVTLEVVNTPRQMDSKGNLKRPNTGDTILEWLKAQPAAGKCLAISNQPFVGYHDAVLRTCLPAEFSIETIGNEVDKNLQLSVFLDNLARWLYQETLRQGIQ